MDKNFLKDIAENSFEIAKTSSLDTLYFLTTTVLPSVVVCILLLIVGRWMNRRLFTSFGWKGVLSLAWLGTPIHEFSHVIGCWIGFNKIEDFALFKPDKQTGSLGYVQHSFRPNSFYQRVIGNTIIAIAPFFGGSLAIYLLTSNFYPELLVTEDFIDEFSMKNIVTLSGWETIIVNFYEQTVDFFKLLFDEDNLQRWQFWVYLFAMISVSSHLSPSKSDFSGFWWPIALILLLVFIVNFALAVLEHFDIYQFTISFNPVELNSILLLAMLFLSLGAVVVLVLTTLHDLVFGKNRHITSNEVPENQEQE